MVMGSSAVGVLTAEFLELVMVKYHGNVHRKDEDDRVFLPTCPSLSGGSLTEDLLTQESSPPTPPLPSDLLSFSVILTCGWMDRYKPALRSISLTRLRPIGVSSPFGG